jgi:hypothetical protein
MAGFRQHSLSATIHQKSLLPPDTTTGRGTDCNQQAIAPAGAETGISYGQARLASTNCTAAAPVTTHRNLARGVEVVLRYQEQPNQAYGGGAGNTAPAQPRARNRSM